MADKVGFRFGSEASRSINALPQRLSSQSRQAKEGSASVNAWRAKTERSADPAGERRNLYMQEVIQDRQTSEKGATSFPLQLKRIVALTDFSPRSEKAIRYAVQLAKLVGARLTLLHVIPEVAANAYSIEGFPAYEFEDRRQEAGEKLHEELAKAKLEYDAVDTLMTAALHMRDEVIRVATETPADLLVLSTHGYTGWKHAVLGSDAEKILEHAPCPVLVVR
jgi:universal stress protein A